jgi:hypothetical protein
MLPAVAGMTDIHHHAQLFFFKMRWELANFCPGWPRTVMLLISASQVARIISMSHYCPAGVLF